MLFRLLDVDQRELLPVAALRSFLQRAVHGGLHADMGEAMAPLEAGLTSVLTRDDLCRVRVLRQVARCVTLTR